MKKILHYTVTALFLCGLASAQEIVSYANKIRQFQMPSEVAVIWDAEEDVNANGTMLSSLAINPGGARFELWTLKSSSLTGLTEYELASSYVGTYIPLASVVIRSEDETAAVPRTRADRPFHVDIEVTGLRQGIDNPEASKSVKFLRHVQSYGEDGDGIGIDRTQATLLSQSWIRDNGSRTLSFLINSVPGADRTKVRGEERFSVFSLADYQAPESQISSQYIQIWPVADGQIAGISQGQLVRYSVPQVTLTLNDLYPSSTTYAQVYKGNAQLGVQGTIVPGSALIINDSVPNSRVLILKDYESVFAEDGVWTMELLTKTPFGIDRLAYVSFNLDRTMKMNGSFTTIE